MWQEDPKKLRALFELNGAIDELAEEALKEREGLLDAMKRILPAVCQRVQARAAFVRSFSEDLALTLFSWPPDASIPEIESVLERTGPDRREEVILQSETDLVVAQPLDLAGDWFGSAGIVIPSSVAAGLDPRDLVAALGVVCEQLDNFLYSIRAARERHMLMMQLEDALSNRVLGEGLRAAVSVLAGAVAFDRLLLVSVAEADQAEMVHVQVFNKADIVLDTMGATPSPPDEQAILAEARAYLHAGDSTLVRRLGFVGAREEVLINGVTEASVAGKVLATPRNSGFNTHDRELLAEFGKFVRQRVADFNKEWRTLSRSFRPEDVARLLAQPDYAERYLAPREAEVAILYADIAGFTKLSEQVLRTPPAVAELVEVWGRESVNLLWKHGGVFDKMVGDCVIGLFGPPFFAAGAEAALHAALQAAVEIRAMTRELPGRPGFEHLRATGLGVSTGVNLAPLFVGQFGPNDNFTGFSSGMNNTARLQGCAARNEILVMGDSVARLRGPHHFAFGPERTAKVKNVADPIRFVPLL